MTTKPAPEAHPSAPVAPAVLPAGSSDWQERCAAWKAGEFGSMPLPCCIVTCCPLDPADGSGKLCTP